MKINWKKIIIVGFITLIGGALRFYQNVDNPNSLNIDEVAFGYNAFSVLKTARDEYGVWMPFSFKSVGDYKNPVPVYLMTVPVALFGLNEFAVRFQNVLFATITIPVFFLFFSFLTKSDKVSLLSTALLAISPWHIFYSRFAYEGLIATLFIVIGFWMLLKLFDGKEKTLYALSAGLILALSLYTYYTVRLFVPLMILAVFIIYRKRILSIKYQMAIFIAALGVFSSIMLWSVFFGQDAARAKMVLLTKDIEFTRNINTDNVRIGGGNQVTQIVRSLSEPLNSSTLLLSNFWIKRYLNYLQPDFLFLRGMNMTLDGTHGVGPLYLFEIPFFILGFVLLIKKNIPNKPFIVSWILLGIFPATLANNEQHVGRALIIIPMVLLISGYGGAKLLDFVGGLRSIKWRSISYLLIGGTFLFSVLSAWLVYTVHYPYEKSEAFMYGTKEAILFALENKDRYREIVFDPVRGIEGPYIVSVPYMYTLFYSSYDPQTYQNTPKRSYLDRNGNDVYGFDKFTFRRIDWLEDRFSTDTLFIGSPWSIPLQDLKSSNILKKVYLANGQLAFVIVDNSISR